MSAIDLSPECKVWHPGDSTKHTPHDSNFLEILTKAGFVAFIGPGGLCGAKSDRRCVVAIHRGRGQRWECVFRENDCDVLTTFTTDLGAMAVTMIAWLRGRPLSAEENSVHAVA